MCIRDRAYAGSPLPLAGVACVFVVVFLRYWSVYFDWKTINEADLTPHVAVSYTHLACCEPLFL